MGKKKFTYSDYVDDETIQELGINLKELALFNWEFGRNKPEFDYTKIVMQADLLGKLTRDASIYYSSQRKTIIGKAKKNEEYAQDFIRFTANCLKWASFLSDKNDLMEQRVAVFYYYLPKVIILEKIKVLYQNLLKTEIIIKKYFEGASERFTDWLCSCSSDITRIKGFYTALNNYLSRPKKSNLNLRYLLLPPLKLRELELLKESKKTRQLTIRETSELNNHTSRPKKSKQNIRTENVPGDPFQHKERNYEGAMKLSRKMEIAQRPLEYPRTNTPREIKRAKVWILSQQGLRQTEIAEIMGIKRETVSKLQHTNPPKISRLKRPSKKEIEYISRRYIIDRAKQSLTQLLL